MTSTYSSISNDAFKWPTTETEAALKRIQELEQKRLQIRAASSARSDNLDSGTRLSRRQQLGGHRIGSRKFSDGQENRRSNIIVRRRIHENTNSDIDSSISTSYGSLDTTGSIRYGGARPKNFEISSLSKRSFLPQDEDNYIRERSSSLTNSGETEGISLFRSQSVTGLSPRDEIGSYEMSLGSDIKHVKDTNNQPAESTVNTSVSEDEDDIENFKRSLLGTQNLANVPEHEEPVLQTSLQTSLPKFTRNETEINTSRLVIEPISIDRTFSNSKSLDRTMFSNTKSERSTELKTEKKIDNILNRSMKKFDQLFETPRVSRTSTLPSSQRSSRFERLSQNSRLSSSGRSGISRDTRRVYATDHLENTRSDDQFCSQWENNSDIPNINVSDKEIEKHKTARIDRNNINETSEIDNVENDEQSIQNFSNVLHSENDKVDNSVINGIYEGQINFKSGIAYDASDLKETQPYPETSDINESDIHAAMETGDHVTIQSDDHVTTQTGDHVTIQSEDHVTMQTGDHVTMQTGDHVTMQTGDHVTMQSNDHVTMQTGDHVTMQNDDQLTIQTNIEDGNEHNTSAINYEYGNSVENQRNDINPYTSLVQGEIEDDLVDESNVDFFETFNNQQDGFNENMFDDVSQNETNFPTFSNTTDFLNYDQNSRYESLPAESMYQEQNYGYDERNHSYNTFPSRSQRSMSLDHQSHFRTVPYSVGEQDRSSSREKSFRSNASADVFSKIDEIFNQKSVFKEIESKTTRPRPRDVLRNSKRVSRTRSDVGHGTTYGNRYNRSSLRRTFTNSQNDNSTYIQNSYSTNIDNSSNTDSYRTKWRREFEENDSYIEQVRARVNASRNRTSLFDRSKSLDLTPSDETVVDSNDYVYNQNSDILTETNNENIGIEISALTNEISSEFDIVDNSEELNGTLQPENELIDNEPHIKDESDNIELPLDEELTFTSSCQVEVGEVLVCSTENIKGAQLEETNNNELDESLGKYMSSDDKDLKTNNENHLDEQSNVENNTDKNVKPKSVNSTDKTTESTTIDNTSTPSSSSKRKKNKKKGKKGNNSDTSKIIVSHPSELLAREKKVKKDSKVKDNVGKSEKESVTEEKSEKRGKGILSSLSKNKKQKDKTADTSEKSPKKSEKQISEKKSPEKEETKQTNTDSPKSPSKLKNLFDSIIHALDHKSETSSTTTASLEDNKSLSSGEKTPLADDWEIISEPLSSELNVIQEDNYATFTDEDIVQEKRRLSDEVSGVSTDNYETASDHTISGDASEYEEFYEALPTDLIEAWTENELLMETERKEQFVYVCAESKVRRKRKKIGEWISNNLYPGEKYPEQGENVSNRKFTDNSQQRQDESKEHSEMKQQFIRKEESSEPSKNQGINNQTSIDYVTNSVKIGTEVPSTEMDINNEFINSKERNSEFTNTIHEKHLNDESAEKDTKLQSTEINENIESNEYIKNNESNSELTKSIHEKHLQKTLHGESTHENEIKNKNEQFDLAEEIVRRANEQSDLLKEVVKKANAQYDLLKEEVKKGNEQRDLTISTSTTIEKTASLQLESVPTEKIPLDLKASDAGFTDTLVNTLREKLCSSCQGVLQDVLKQTYFARCDEISKINLTESDVSSKMLVNKAVKSETIKVNSRSEEGSKINFPKSHVSKKLKVEDLLYGDNGNSSIHSVKERNRTVEQSKTDKSKGSETVNWQKSKSRETTPTRNRRKLSVPDKSSESSTSVKSGSRKSSVEIKVKGKTVTIDKNKKEEKISPKSDDKPWRQNSKLGIINDNKTNTEDNTDESEEFRLPNLKNNPFIRSDKLRTSVRKENREKKNDKTTKTVVSKSDQSMKGAKSSKSPSPEGKEGSISSKSPSPDGKQDIKLSSPTKQGNNFSFLAKQDSKSSSVEKLDSESNYSEKQDSDSSSPSEQNSDSSSPSKQDSKSSSPAKQDSNSSSPGKQDSNSSSLTKQDSNLSSPVKQDSNSSSPVKQDSKSSSPVKSGLPTKQDSNSGSSAKQDIKTVVNGTNSSKSSSPKKENIENGKNNSADRVRKTSTGSTKKPSMFDHLNFAKTVCEGLGPGETINKSNSAETVQKKTKTPPKKKKFSFGDTDIIDDLDISPEELHGVPVDGDDEVAPHRINLINWDPTKLLNVLYMVKLMKDTVEDVSHKFVNMEGLMEKLPMNKKKATLLKTWKRRFFRAKDGWLHYYETSNRDRPSDSVQLMGGKIEDLGNRVLGIDDGRGRFLMVRCPTEKEYGQWKLALESQTVDNVKATYVRPALLSPPHPEKKVIIIDIGSGGIRAGVMGAQPCLPKIFIPSIVARNKTTQELVIGVDAYKPEVRKNSTLVKLVEPSNKVDKFAIDMEIMTAVCNYIFKGLGVDPNKYWIMLSTPYKLGDTAMTNLMDILTDKFHVKGVCMVMQSLLALYSYNATSGIIVDVGERMEILPIFDGVLIEGGVSRQAYGGQKVADSLNSSLVELKYKFFTPVDKLLVRYVMEQSCYVCDNYKEVKSKCDKDPQDYQTTIYLNNFDLPDDSHLSVTHDASCFKSPEGFFNTDLWGMDYPCVHKLVYQAIQSCPMDNRKHMYRAIYLSGGVTMLPGFAERLQIELKKLAPPSVVVEVHASPQRYHSAFIGAGTLLSNVPINEQIFISSEEWKRDKVKAFRKWKGP